MFFQISHDVTSHQGFVANCELLHCIVNEGKDHFVTACVGGNPIKGNFVLKTDLISFKFLDGV